MDSGSRLGPYALLASGMAIFGSGTPVSKIVTDAFPVFVASGARMGLAALALVPVAVLIGDEAFRERLRSIPRDDWIRIGAIALFGMFLFSLFMLYGMAEIPGAVGGIVMATTPAVTAAGSVLFLRDRLDRWKALAIALAVGGVVAVNVGGVTEGGGDGNLVLGTLLVFGAVCGEAAYTLLGKRVSADLDPPTIAALAAVAATVMFAPLVAVQASELDVGGVATTDWLALVWWGLGTMALGSVLWYLGVQRVPATTASAFMGVMPVSALLLSYLLLGEAFEPIHLVGMAAVLAGIAAVTYSDRSQDEEDGA